MGFRPRFHPGARPETHQSGIAPECIRLGDRDSNPNYLIQSQTFCRLNYPPLVPQVAIRLSIQNDRKTAEARCSQSTHFPPFWQISSEVEVCFSLGKFWAVAHMGSRPRLRIAVGSGSRFSAPLRDQCMPGPQKRALNFWRCFPHAGANSPARLSTKRTLRPLYNPSCYLVNER